MSKTTLFLIRVSVFCAVYVLLSLITFPIASGVIQLRISEGLSLLCLIFPECVLGLTVGCFLSNLITGCVIFDTFFGSIITLVSCLFIILTGKIIKNGGLKVFISGLFPVFFNAFLLPLIWLYCYNVGNYAYIIQVLFLVISQSLSVYGVGIPLYKSIERLRKKGIKYLE